MNVVILVGNLTKDPVLRLSKSNVQICNGSIAVDEPIKDDAGSWSEKPVFVDFSTFGRQAEILAQYASKGSKICLEGRLSLDQWVDRDGNNRSQLVLKVRHVELLGQRPPQSPMAPPVAASNIQEDLPF